MKTLNTLAIALSLTLVNGSAFALVAPFADAGQYRNTVVNGEPFDSAHVNLTNANGATYHQGGLAGHEKGTTFGGSFTHSRRAYYAFDLSGISTQVTAGTLKIWGWAPHPAIGGSGVYHSLDDSETLELRSLDNFSAQQIIDAPYQDRKDHSFDVPVWEDLADGAVYGSRTFTEADEQRPGLIASPTASSSDCSDPSANACGRWFDIDLTAEALADVNSESGIWAFGAIVSTINDSQSEQLFGGTVFDWADTNSSYYPDFQAPSPELHLTTSPVPVPAAVWLFGSALAGLVGVKRKKAM